MPLERILLAAPRGWCAGVERAVDIVERALDLFGPPSTCASRSSTTATSSRVSRSAARSSWTRSTRCRRGRNCVLSAHGSAPTVYETAQERKLQLIDATCPLVTKVHVEAIRFAKRERTIVLIGHAGHEEVEGTMGQAPARTVLVESVADAERLEVADPENVSYITQTTLVGGRHREPSSTCCAGASRRFAARRRTRSATRRRTGRPPSRSSRRARRSFS